jgi:hypothetical protein
MTVAAVGVTIVRVGMVMRVIVWVIVVACGLRSPRSPKVPVWTRVRVDVDEAAVPVQRASAGHADLRRANRQTPPAAAESVRPAMATTFAVTHVRQALQQTAADGAFSPNFATTGPTRPVAICFTPEG